MLKNINGILISEDDINILKKYNIDILKCHSIREVQLLIERIIGNTDLLDEEVDILDNISINLQEIHYYKDTNK